MRRNGYPAIEGELEGEYELEWEGELETEFEWEEEDEGEWENEFEDLVRELELEEEDEYELEEEAEWEDFANPNLRASRLGVAQDAELMAHFATMAANAESEAEAEAFLGALIPLAAKILPKALPVIRKVGPQLIKGVANVGRQLWNRPETRQLVKAVPDAVLKTAGDLAGQWADGQDITLRKAAGTFGRNMADTLRSNRTGAVRATNQLNRRHQQRHGGRGGHGGHGGHGYRTPSRRRRQPTAPRRVAGRRRYGR